MVKRHRRFWLDGVTQTSNGARSDDHDVEVWLER